MKTIKNVMLGVIIGVVLIGTFVFPVSASGEGTSEYQRLFIDENSIVEVAVKFSFPADTLDLQTKDTEKIKIVVDYINSLRLTYIEEREQLTGGGFKIDITLSNGEQKTFYHLGNTYFVDNDKSYTMEYEQASKFEIIVWELVTGKKYPSEFDSIIAGANANSVKISVDEDFWELSAYNTLNENYFKLRDIACILNKTGKQFEVSWDEDINAISLTSGQSYTKIGGEMQTIKEGVSFPSPTDSKILLNGEEIYLTGFNVNGNNYFRLRDIAGVMGFSVDYIECYDAYGTHNPTKDTIVIDTSKGYAE